MAFGTSAHLREIAAEALPDGFAGLIETLSETTKGSRRMEYRATIHTLELEAVLPGENDSKQHNAFRSELYSRWSAGTLPYVKSIDRDPWRNGATRLILNLHRRTVNPEGRFVLEYWTAEKFESVLRESLGEMGAADYIPRRLDICVDTPRPYEQTEKLLRLPILTLARQNDFTNNYETVDPLTHVPKVLRGDNATRQKMTLQIEHYNRALEDQSNWAFPVVNRLELRTAGARTGEGKGAREAAMLWLELLGRLWSGYEDFIEDENGRLLAAYRRFCEARGTDSTNTRNAFIVREAKSFYTREQLRDFFQQTGSRGSASGKRQTDNFVRRWGNVVELYPLRAYGEEVRKVAEALEIFADL